MTSININSQKFGPLVLALWMGMSVLRIRKRKKGKERTILRFPFSFPKKLKPFLPNTPTSSNTLSSLHFSNSGFLNFGTINILGQIILCVCVWRGVRAGGDCPTYALQDVKQHPWPLHTDASSTPNPVVTIKNVFQILPSPPPATGR